MHMREARSRTVPVVRCRTGRFPVLARGGRAPMPATTGMTVHEQDTPARSADAIFAHRA
jgi:hypothetical protein